jgi:RimJ/RimL family protein N-acetyltransferase
MSPAPTLTDGVVTIRAHHESDEKRVVEQSCDPLSRQWTRVPIPYDLDDARSFVGEFIPRGWADDSEWGFAVEHEGRYAGTISLRNEGEGIAEIAFGSHPAARGTGAMERALRLLVTWGFDERGLRTIVWRANKGNWASRRLAWRLGFSFDGTVRQWLPQRDALRDGWVGTLLRGEPHEPRSTWLDCPVLESDGLRLRPFEQRDAPRITDACAEEITQHWLGHLPSPYTLDDAHAYLESRSEQRAAGTGATWAVVDPADDEILATVGYFDYTPGVECEIGYWTHPDARGRGLMTRAMGMLTRYVIEELGVNRVKAFAAVENTASRRVIEANGFRLTGVERLGAQVRAGRVDMALYDLLAEELAPRT